MAQKGDKKVDGAQKGKDDFSFDDIPVLGAGKSKQDFSFDDLDSAPHKNVKRKGAEKDSRDSSVEMLEKMLLEGVSSSSDKERSSDPNSPHSVPRENWDSYFKQGKSRKTLLIASAGLGAVLLLSILGLFIFLSVLSPSSEGKKQETAPPPKETKSPEAATEKTGSDSAKAEEPKADPDEIFHRQFEKANQLIEDKKYSEALPLFEELTSKNAQVPGLRISLAKVLYSLGKKDAALAALQEQKKIFGSDPATLSLMIEVLDSDAKTAESEPFAIELIEKFPDFAPGHPVLAQHMLAANKPQIALEFFRKSQKQDLSLKQILAYGGLCEKNDPKEAISLYQYGGKKFQSLEAFKKTLRLLQKPEERKGLIEDAIVCLNNEAAKTSLRIMLAEIILKSGKKEDAVPIIEALDSGSIAPEASLDYLRLLCQAGLSEKLKKEASAMIQKGSGDFSKMKELMAELDSNGLSEIKTQAFDELCQSKKDAVSEYLYGLCIRESPVSRDYFESTVRKKPIFPEAWEELGDSCARQRDWNAAVNAYRKSLQISDSRELRKKLASAEIYSSGSEDGIRTYHSYLLDKKVSKSQIALELLPLWQTAGSKQMADKCLKEIQEDPALKGKYRELQIKNKMIFGGISDDDFSEGLQGEIRDHYQIYLLAQGREKELLSMLTPPKRFPEFWKVFVCWKLGAHGWRETAETLAANSAKSGNKLVSAIASMWLDKVTPDDLRAIANRIPYEDEALFFFMIGMKYMKDGNPSKARVCFYTALKHKNSPLRDVIMRYSGLGYQEK